MISKIKEEIKVISEVCHNRRKFGVLYSNILVAYLICLKYLCEVGDYKISEVVKEDKLYEINSDIKRIIVILKDDILPINKILKDYMDVSARDLLVEFLREFEKPVLFHTNEEVLFMGIVSNMFSYYDDKGMSTYIIPDSKIRGLDVFRCFDKILGIENKYLLEKDIEKNKYNYLYIYNTTPRYRFIRNDNEYIKIDDYINNIENIILYTTYSKIGNFKDGRSVAKYIKYVILDGNFAIMVFNKDTTGISIINYDREKMSKEKLLSVTSNNRKQKGVLVKTNYDEVKSNNLRIGFNLYELEKDDIRDINKIVDKNTEYLEELNRINDMVEREINKLLNR